MTATMLQTVDQAKKERFSTKLQKLEDGEWTRDNFSEKVNEVENTLEIVDELITSIQAEIEELTGGQSGEGRRSELIEEFGEDHLERLRGKDLGGGFSPTLKQLREVDQRVAELRRKENEWKAYQFEVARVAMEKLEEIGDAYRREFTGSEVAENLMQSTENYVDEQYQKLEERVMRKVEKKIANTDQAIQAARMEAKFYREFFEQHGTVTVEALQSLSESVEEIEQHLESADDGLVDGSTTSINAAEQEDVSSETGESATDDSSTTAGQQGSQGSPADTDVEYPLKEHDLEGRLRTLQELAENEPVEHMSQQNIAGLTDLDRSSIFPQGTLLDRIKDEFGVDLREELDV